MSERKIAETVFGDARYRGRIERILRPRPRSSTSDPAGKHPPGAANEEVRRGRPEPPSIRQLVDRHRRRLTHEGDLPSLKEIELLLKLERQLEAEETLERLNALTREVG